MAEASPERRQRLFAPSLEVGRRDAGSPEHRHGVLAERPREVVLLGSVLAVHRCPVCEAANGAYRPDITIVNDEQNIVVRQPAVAENLGSTEDSDGGDASE